MSRTSDPQTQCPSAMSSLPTAGEIGSELARLRPIMLKFARLQLRNAAAAEDAVSETVLAVLSKPASFSGRSQLKTWVLGILKHKLVDQLRMTMNQVQLSEEVDEQDFIDSLFVADGHWAQPPSVWGDPERSLHQVDFFRVLEACVEKLPAQQGRVFMMREWLDLEVEEIRRAACVSENNYWVLMHRARLRLRECLELNWFSTCST